MPIRSFLKVLCSQLTVHVDEQEEGLLESSASSVLHGWEPIMPIIGDRNSPAWAPSVNFQGGGIW